MMLLSSLESGIMTKSKRTRWDLYFLSLAKLTSGMSYANKLKVGAVAVRQGRIVCTGFNGTPPGGPNECEDINGNTLGSVSHAEENLVAFAARYGIKLKGCSVYVTHSPCIRCARKLLAAGIKKVVYIDLYKNSDGIDLLRLHGVKIIEYSKHFE